MNKIKYDPMKNYFMLELAPTNFRINYGAYKGFVLNHNYMIENMVDVLNKRGPITKNALDRLKVVDIIEKIYHQVSKNILN